VDIPTDDFLCICKISDRRDISFFPAGFGPALSFQNDVILISFCRKTPKDNVDDSEIEESAAASLILAPVSTGIYSLSLESPENESLRIRSYKTWNSRLRIIMNSGG
jgi:hypothetical protein